MKMTLRSWVLGLLLLMGCRTESPPNFLVLGHIYYWDDPRDRVDPRVAALDLSGYDGVWLVGDLARKSSERTTTLDTLNQKFDFGDPNVHWALGNHDLYKGDSARIVARTGRPTFHYAPEVAPGWNLLVLNTELFSPPERILDEAHCAQLERQLALAKRVTKLQQPDEYLIVLHHGAVIPQVRADTFPRLSQIWNVYHPERMAHCSGGTFAEALLPYFDRAAQRGVSVVFIGGDLGQRVKRFEHRDAHGILWLGTGIGNSAGTFRSAPAAVTDFSPDHVLLVEPDPQTRAFTHRFVPLSDLPLESTLD